MPSNNVQYNMFHGIPIETNDSVVTYLCSDQYMTQTDKNIAKRIHSINFTVRYPQNALGANTPSSLNFNTYGDFRLIPTKRPVIAIPKMNTSYVEVPGSKNGDWDLSEALTGDITFKNREGTLEFMYENSIRYEVTSSHSLNAFYNASGDIIQNSAGLKYAYGEIANPNDETPRKIVGYKTWNEIYDSLIYYLHGRWADMTLMDDLGTAYEHHYTGRWWVDSFESGENSFGKVVLSYKLDPHRFISGSNEVYI